MTDIVERLRGPIIDGDTLDDAAAEIERLQSELATSRELCTKFEMAVGRDVETILELRNQLVSVKAALTGIEEGTECGWARGRARKALRALTDD